MQLPHEHSAPRAKLKHIQACLLPESQYNKGAGFAEIDFDHEAAAGLRYDDICTRIVFLHHELKAPLMIAPMTGGMDLGAMLNQRWARAAQHFGLAFGVGSQRIALEDAKARASFRIRPYAPGAFIFANLGAAQVLRPEGVGQALLAVEMIEANALFIHLNPLQEACQAHGDRDFSGILAAIARVVALLHKHKVPVLVREVGFGLSKKAARALLDCGVAGLDCAGAGGTSWAKVEALCAEDEKYRRLGMLFGEWGIPTAQSIANVRKVSSSIPLIATGGIRSGLDIVKAVRLGANVAGMAQPMLAAAIESEEALFLLIERLLCELKTAMLAMGLSHMQDLDAKKPCG